jgi:CubicO group peptidase (beta-lactamase class C family)
VAVLVSRTPYPLPSLQRLLTVALLLAAVILTASRAIAQEPLQAAPSPSAEIDRLMEQAGTDGLLTGGVVLVGRHDDILLEKAYGYVSAGADARPVTTDTIFDLASLTKVFATAPAVMKLAEEGRIRLVDPVARWFPEFAGRGRDDLLLMHLLTHTSGLDDMAVGGDEPLRRAIESAAAQRPRGEAGSRFRYADINFILLGELVRRVTGIPLDEYCRQHFLASLGMVDSGFRPAEPLVPRIAPTVVDNGTLSQGVVQDRTARQLGGVAGHAGLFGTARDLARFCRMVLNDGALEGKRVLSPRTVEQMTAPYFSRGGKVVRGLGWDIASPFSSPRGEGFSEMSFGHTGYAGGSVWIDPDRGLYVVLLTSRLDYRRTRDFSTLRSGISTAALQLSDRRELVRHEEGPALNP